MDDNVGMPALPPDLQDVLEQIDRSDRSADEIAAAATYAQFHWQPDGGRAWSIAQCLEHLGTMNRVYGDAASTGVELARQRGWRRTGPIASSWVGRWFIGSLEPPVKRRLGAPSKTRPGSTATREQILARYHESHDRLRRLVTACADLDVNRATFENPFIGFLRVRVGTAFRIMMAHDRRHLWQAAQVRKAPGFPAR